MRKEYEIIVSYAFILPKVMSSSASISAAKKRRANQPNMQPMPMQPMQPQMQRPISAPGAPGAIPLANLTPAQRQQYLQQQQIRLQQPQMLQQQMLQQQMLQQHQQQHQHQLQQQQQQQHQTQKQNPVNYNQQSQPPKLSWPAPPIYIMKQMDTLLFQQGQSIDEIKNRLNCIETGSSDGAIIPSINNIENIKSDPEFINGIVDNIMSNSNLSEIIEQIDVVQNENRELRDLLHAQQKTINEMNIMLLKLFSQVHNLVREDQVKPIKPVEAAESSEAVEAVEAVEAAESAESEGEEVEGLESSSANVELEITDK